MAEVHVVVVSAFGAGFSSRPPEAPFVGKRTFAAIGAESGGCRAMDRLLLSAAIIALAALTAWAFSAPSTGSGAEAGVRVGPGEAYNPVTAGESLPDGFRQLLARDAIAPVYEPVFVAAADAGWPGTAEVIGVTSGNEAKAYPVSFLNRREMVIDRIDGIPILVTW
jgi:hypothetical protein